MPRSTTSPHAPEDEESVALWALGVLDTAEREAFEPHLLNCERCLMILAQDRQTLARLDAVAPALEPSNGFKQRLLQRAADEMSSSGTVV